MKGKKRIQKSISLFLAAAMVLSLAGGSLVSAAEPADAEAEVKTYSTASGTCGASDSDDVVWSYEDGVLTISGTGKMADISSREGGPWNDYYSEIESVVIEDGVTSIGDYAFSAMHQSTNKNITSVTIGNTVKLISSNAFWWCRGLTTITIPASVTKIEYWAFCGCSGLESVIFEGDAPAFGDDIFAYTDELTAYYPADNETWTEDVMQDYGGTITWVSYESSSSSGSGSSSDSGSSGSTSDSTLGDNLSWSLSDGTLTVSGTGAMASYYDIASYPWYSAYSEIEEVVIESGVTSIGASAFECGYYGMTSNIKSVTIADTVTKIEDYAFSECTSLKSITFEGDAPEFGNLVFYGAEATAYYPANNSTWTSDVMQDYGGTLTWESYGDSSSGSDNGSTSGGSSDSGSTNSGSTDNGSSNGGSSDSGSSNSGSSNSSSTDDSSVTWTLNGNTLMISGSGAMEDYKNSTKTPWYTYKSEITKVVIGSGVTSIGTSAFANFSDLTSVSIASTVTSIGEYAFEDTGLTNVTIPDSVETIGGGSFGMCSSLKTVTIGSGVTFIDFYAFEECASLTTVTFTGDAPSFGDYVFYGDKITAYYPNGNSTWTANVRQNYGGTVTWKANKPAQTITVKAASLKKSYKASKLKSKKQTFKIKASAKGKLTYTKKSGNKKITVSKNGKVTVKKGLAKGTYKVKVKIKAAATSKYAAKTVTKTVKITVK